jgi:hypothetical protein
MEFVFGIAIGLTCGVIGTLALVVKAQRRSQGLRPQDWSKHAR